MEFMGRGTQIFYAFLIMMVSVFLWLLPISESTYAFRTDLREDSFTVETLSGITTANVTLFDEVYDDDTSTIDISSSDADDSPLYSSYNSTTRLLAFSGLAESTNRTIDVSYDVDALRGSGVFHTLMDNAPWIYIVLVIALPVGGLVVLFWRPRR
jgi:hypothetical protein